MEQEGKEMANLRAVPLRRLLRFTGRGAWVTGLTPEVNAFLGCLWAAMAEAEKAKRERLSDQKREELSARRRCERR